MAFTYPHARPALTVDCVVFGWDAAGLQVLLIERDLEPFAGRWALPGGFVHIDETVDAAARRELREETGLEKLYLEQLYTFGDLARDPRERVVSVAYYALVRLSEHPAHAATDARAAEWHPVRRIPPLAFDHDAILAAALARLQAKVRYQPVGFELLPPKFTLTQVQRLYEVILERALDKRNFRKKFLSLGVIEELPDRESGVAHRAARLYRFDAKAYRRKVRDGFHFEI
ncbi:MAG: NUDIX hydrolase [Planctomycetota bacterium]